MSNQKKGTINNFTKDPWYRNKVTLILVTIWDILLFTYYILVGWVSTTSENSRFSWFYGLAYWYGVLVVFKLTLCFSLPFLKRNKMMDYSLFTIIYMFINLFEVISVALTPLFVVRVFSTKFGFSLASLIISTVNLILFFLSFKKLKGPTIGYKEAIFLKTKQYISRTEGFFNILLICINILILVNASNNAIKYTYIGVCGFFALMSLIIAIKLIKERKALRKKKRFYTTKAYDDVEQ